MEYRRINVAQIDDLWELQKLYKSEIGEEEPDKLGFTIPLGNLLAFE